MTEQEREAYQGHQECQQTPVLGRGVAFDYVCILVKCDYDCILVKCDKRHLENMVQYQYDRDPIFNYQKTTSTHLYNIGNEFLYVY